jgi:hypothetical protein
MMSMMGLRCKTFVCAAMVAVLLVFAARPAAAEGPVLDRFFPAGVERGGEAQVQALGRLGGWPLKAWSDWPGLSIVALPEPGQLLVRAAADAEPGVHWVRLYAAAGASELRPLLVGTLPELSDHEPNDTWRAAQRLEHSACTINGRLASPGDCDVFAVKVQAGQTLVAWVEAEHRLGSPMDGVLQILDSAGTVVAQNHDAIGLDPCTSVESSTGGVYFVRLFAFPAKPSADIQLAGGEDYVYRLTVTSQAAASYAFPLSIGRSGRQAVQLRGWNLSPGTSRRPRRPSRSIRRPAGTGSRCFAPTAPRRPRWPARPRWRLRMSPRRSNTSPTRRSTPMRFICPAAPAA